MNVLKIIIIILIIIIIYISQIPSVKPMNWFLSSKKLIYSHLKSVRRFVNSNVRFILPLLCQYSFSCVSYVHAKQLLAPHYADVVALYPERLADEVPYATVTMPGKPENVIFFDEVDTYACLGLRRNGYQHADMVEHQHHPQSDTPSWCVSSWETSLKSPLNNLNRLLRRHSGMKNTWHLHTHFASANFSFAAIAPP